MKITFTQQTINESEIHRKDRKPKEETTEMQTLAFAGAGAYSVVFQKGQSDIMPGQQAEKGRSLIEIQQAAGYTDVGISQDYMTLAANTMSEEDYARMQEEGFDFGSLNPEEAVTIVDKIKAELVRSGKHIAGYTDDLDLAVLTEALGSETLAKAVSDSFAQADIPLTEENVAAVLTAWNQVSKLQPMTEGAYAYLIDNGLESEIWNLYLAQNSGAATAKRPWANAAEENIGKESLAGQIEHIIAQSTLPVDEQSKAAAKWLLEEGLPLTVESLNRLAKLQELQLPVSEEAFAKAVAGAIVSGKQTIHANLSGEPDIYEKAVRLAAYYQGDEAAFADVGDITARRQLEEIRLRMTAEVNVKLQKSGFAIDTAPMEALVDALRQAERQLAEQYFPEDTAALDKYEIYRDTNRVVADLPDMPADILGVFAKGQPKISLVAFHEEGRTSREEYARANKQYEALMTAPRSDLGDSIKKAFANVEDILRDLGLEPTEENVRAVRILGYNRMEINTDNIQLIEAADSQVKHIMERLTPAATLKMIRDGINPLEKSFGELEQYFDTLPGEYLQESESYSRFLYGLERNHEITAQERDSFIGIYRLLRQIEKSDGAVVGALVNTQAELHFSNLLTAVRSGRVRSLDVQVTDRLGALAEMPEMDGSISRQISAAYNKEQMQTLRGAVLNADADCVAMLQRGQLPANADNLLAAQALLHGGDGAWRKLVSRRSPAGSRAADESPAEELSTTETLTEGSDGDELWQRLEDKSLFTERYADRLQAELEAVERETFDGAQGYLDVKRMQLEHKQLTVAVSLAKQEEFILPMYVGDELMGVHITFEKSTEKKGGVAIRVFSQEGTSIEATLQFSDGKLRGIFAGDGRDALMKLEKTADIFKESAREFWELGDIRVEYMPDGHATSPIPDRSLQATENPAMEDAQSAPDNAELYQVAKLFLQSVQRGDVIYEN